LLRLLAAFNWPNQQQVLKDKQVIITMNKRSTMYHGHFWSAIIATPSGHNLGVVGWTATTVTSRLWNISRR
jgi:glucose/arabinose dehydrogenase